MFLNLDKGYGRRHLTFQPLGGAMRCYVLAALAAATVLSTVGVTAATVAPAAADELPSRTFSYTGAPQTFTVPFGVTAVQFDVSGASGGDAQPWSGAPAIGGLGGRITGALAVVPGSVLTVVVGGRGANGARTGSSGNGAGGYNGGGNGGAPGDANGQGAGGGGGSDIRVGGTALADRVVVAGGGGGATPTIPNGGVGASGGHGGGLTGQDGGNACADPEREGKGATPLAGGAGAAGSGVAPGTSGGLGYGGSGGSYAFYSNGEGGGGGGGYYGGGGGSSQTAPTADGAYYCGGGGGGGGSSYAGPGAVRVLDLAGQHSGDGVVVLTWTGATTGVMPSADCSSGTIFEGTTAGVYTKLRVQVVTPAAVWICFRIDAGSLGRVGGKVVVSGALGVGALPNADSDAAACGTAPGNIVPGPHPIAQGTIGDALAHYSLDTYASSSQAWVCLAPTVGNVDQSVRIVVPVTTVTLPGVALLLDTDSTLG